LSHSNIATPTVNWQSEMKRIATKHNVIVCWVAVVLNPIWFIADYFTISNYWIIFLKVRLLVTALTLLALVLRKKISTELLLLFPVLGISIQNAFMWSVMDISQLQQHAFAYIALFIGAGMLLLWKPLWSIVVLLVSFLANILFLKANSALSAQEILINGGMLVATVAIISVVLIHSRYTLTKKEIIARMALAELNKELEIKNNIIVEKNKDITDSINYAKRIQYAMLPHRKDILAAFPNSFVLFMPKDIVSGDFYFFHKNDKSVFIASADCTGHGVPGAFMSMIGSERLTDAVQASSNTSEILSLLNNGIKTSLKQSENENSTWDGMDIAICSVDIVNRIVKYAGANRPLWIIRKGQTEVEEIKATKKAIGGYTEDSQHFDTHEIKLQQGDTFYLFTDGYADTFGGEKSKKVTTKRFKQLLIDIQSMTMKEQAKHLDGFIENWKAGIEQVDDILVIGIRL